MLISEAPLVALIVALELEERARLLLWIPGLVPGRRRTNWKQRNLTFRSAFTQTPISRPPRLLSSLAPLLPLLWKRNGLAATMVWVSALLL